MKLTKSDKEYLKSRGYLDEDMEQIERATVKTVYMLNHKDRISCTKAIELLGREVFLSGIGRSTFHWNTARETADGKNVISFDSSKLFKQ